MKKPTDSPRWSRLVAQVWSILSHGRSPVRESPCWRKSWKRCRRWWQRAVHLIVGQRPITPPNGQLNIPTYSNTNDLLQSLVVCYIYNIIISPHPPIVLKTCVSFPSPSRFWKRPSSIGLLRTDGKSQCFFHGEFIDSACPFSGQVGVRPCQVWRRREAPGLPLVDGFMHNFWFIDHRRNN